MRVFIARSDPALNYGYLSGVLLALVALVRLGALEQETGVAIYPVIGVGSVPFRGGLAPLTVDRVLRNLSERADVHDPVRFQVRPPAGRSPGRHHEAARARASPAGRDR